MQDIGELKAFQSETVDAVIEKYKKVKRVLVTDEVGMGKTKIAKGIIHELSLSKQKSSYRVLYMAPSAAVLSENIRKLMPKDNEPHCYSTRYIPGDRLINLFLTNALEENKKEEKKNIEIFSMSPGIVFETHSKLGTEKERDIIGTVLEKCFQEGCVKVYLDKLFHQMDISFTKKSVHISDEERNFICDEIQKEIEIKYLKIIVSYINDNKGCDNFYKYLLKNYKNIKTHINWDIQKPLDALEDFKNLFWMASAIGLPVKIMDEASVKEIGEEFSDLDISLNEEFKECHRWDYSKNFISDYSSELGFIRESYFSYIRQIISMAKFKSLGIDLIIADEFHRYFGEQEVNRIENLLGVNEGCKLLLLSATPYQMNEFKFQKDKKAYYDSIVSEDNKADQGGIKSVETKEPFKTFGDVLYYLETGKIEADSRVKSNTKNIKKEYDDKMRAIKSGIKKLAILANDAEGGNFDKEWAVQKKLTDELKMRISEYVVRTERLRVFDEKSDITIEKYGAFLHENEDGMISFDHYLDTYAKKEAALYKALNGKLQYTESVPYPISFCKGYADWKSGLIENGDKNVYEVDLSEYLKDNRETVETLKEKGAIWNGDSYKPGNNMKLDCLIRFLSCSKAEIKKDAAGKEALAAMGKILWLPPLHSTEELKGPFKDFKEAAKGDYSKTLVFCKYKMTANAIAALLTSYTQVTYHIEGDDNIDSDFIDGFDGSDFYKRALKISETDKETDNGTENPFSVLNNAFRKYFKKNYAVLKRAGVTDIRGLQQYCKDGCLSDVLKEWFFVNEVENIGDLNKENPETRKTVCEELSDAINYQTTKIKYFSGENISDGRLILNDKDYVECHFAGVYTEDVNDSGDYKPEHAINISNAFQSPFYPFVLTTTSRAQEGIDLHFYCDRIMHWDLVINPASFEQREGRINRRLCYFIRKRAAGFWEQGSEFEWRTLFENLAEKPAENVDIDYKGLYPDWYLKYADGSEIYLKRLIVNHPFNSKEMQTYNLLELLLGLYRISLGLDVDVEWIQNIIEYIKNNNSKYNISDIMINLSPAFSENP